MIRLDVFDRALCCATGVCGPAPDAELVRFRDDLDWLKGRGVLVERYNLAEEAEAFVGNEKVKGILAREGNESLPVILVNGEVVSRGVYPAREELAEYVGIEAGDGGQESEPAPCSCGKTESDFFERLAGYRPAVHHYILTIVRNGAEADDLTQDTLLRAREKAESLKEPERLEGWLYRIATNICYDRFRQASYRKEKQAPDVNDDEAGGSGSAGEPADPAPRLDLAMEQREMSTCVQKYLAELPDTYRAAIMLHDMEGLTNPEIAAMLGVPLATVKIRLHRARKKLRAALEEACTFSIDERGVCVCEPKGRENKK